MTISVIRLSDSIHLRHSVSHNRSMELIQSCFLEEGRGELPIPLSTSFVLPSQEVHEFCINIVQNSERPLRRILGRSVELSLKYPHSFLWRVLSLLGNHAVPPSSKSVAEVGALCSEGFTLLLRSYRPLRLPIRVFLGTSAFGLISSVTATRDGGLDGVSSVTPLLFPCVLPSSPREPR